MIDNIISGVIALFKVNKVPSKYVQYGSVLDSLKTMRISQRLENERSEVTVVDKDPDDDIEFSLSDFFQLCQESQVISKLLNAILQLCSKQQVSIGV
jgi:hypothetical protein